MSARPIAPLAARLGLLALMTAGAGSAGAQPNEVRTNVGDSSGLLAEVYLDAADDPGATQPGAEAPAPRAVTPPAANDPFRRYYTALHPLRVGAMVQNGAFGESLAPADETIRAQLGLPEGQGLVVVGAAENCPGLKLGIKKDDILLTLGGKPIQDATAFDAMIRAMVKPEALDLIRAGKRIAFNVEPVEAGRGTGGEFYIGVPVGKVDNVLRAHLDIPAGQGLVVQQIMPDSPAARAGLEPNDILLTIAGQPIADVKELSERVQASKGKTLTLSVVRKAKPLSLEVTPEKRKPPLTPMGDFVDHGRPVRVHPGAQADAPFALKFVGPGVMVDYPAAPGQPTGHVMTQDPQPTAAVRWVAVPSPAPADDVLKARLDEVIKQLNAQAASLQELKAMLAKEAKGPGAEK